MEKEVPAEDREVVAGVWGNLAPLCNCSNCHKFHMHIKDIQNSIQDIGILSMQMTGKQEVRGGARSIL